MSNEAVRDSNAHLPSGSNGDSRQPFGLVGGPSDDTRTVIDRLFGSSFNGAEETEINLQLDPTLADYQAGPGPDENLSDQRPGDSGSDVNSPATQKRKGTSRANMLARGAACEFCKKRKLRCSADLPTCAACLKSGRVCVYSQKKQKSRVRTLEDRLMELEKRLDDQDKSDLTPVTGDPSSVSETLRTKSPENPTDGMESSMAEFDLSFFGLEAEEQSRLEPDLMTLADAAAADTKTHSRRQSQVTWPWDDLSPEEIGSEIVKAVEGGKGTMGEKIVGHLFHLYTSAPVPNLSLSLTPSAFLTRLSSPSPPHPTLVLSIIMFLLPISPSSALSDLERRRLISNRIEASANLHSQHAIATIDPRWMDIIGAGSLRTYACFENARLLEGWTIGAHNIALMWATGLGKLGGAGNQLLNDRRDVMTQDRDDRLRDIRFRGMLMPPVKSFGELAMRINVFWKVYLSHKAACVGWNYPSLIDEDAVTTPFPRDSYNDPEAIRDNITIKDFLAGKGMTGQTDSSFCSLIKGLCILARASRLFDTPHSMSPSSEISQLKKTTLTYMDTMEPLVSSHWEKDEENWCISEGWQLFHCAMMLLHLREEVEAEEGSNAAASSLANAISSAENVVKALEAIQHAGDQNLDGYSALSGTVWMTAGRIVFRLAMRLEKLGRSEARRALQLRQMGQKFIDACKIMGRRMPYASVLAQALENNAQGSDAKMGEWERTNFVA